METQENKLERMIITIENTLDEMKAVLEEGKENIPEDFTLFMVGSYGIGQDKVKNIGAVFGNNKLLIHSLLNAMTKNSDISRIIMNTAFNFIIKAGNPLQLFVPKDSLLGKTLDELTGNNEDDDDYLPPFFPNNKDRN